MTWVVLLNGLIEDIPSGLAARVVTARQGSLLTDSQAQTAMARGSATRAATGTALSMVDAADPSDPAHASADFGGEGGPIGTMNGQEDGQDLRFPDLFYDEHGNLVDMPNPQNGHDADSGADIGTAGLVGLGAAALALRGALVLLRRLMGTATTVTRAHWDALPGWARTALATIGIAVAVDMSLDVPGIPGESAILDVLGGGGDLSHETPHMVDGHLGAHIVGGWTANGVRFYRLSDGKLAVQNKRGRWKVWRPKKPVVLMPGGATNLRTLLKADKILNAQAKKIASMLNRRAPRSRKSPQKADNPVVIVQNDGHTKTY